MHTNEGRGKSISHILPEMTVLNRSVQFSPSVSDSLRPQHTKRSIHHQLPESTQPMSIVSVMPSNHLILVIPFSSCPQSSPSSVSFQMSQFFTSGGQSIGVSASTSVLPMNTQDWSPLGWTGWNILFNCFGHIHLFIFTRQG